MTEATPSPTLQQTLAALLEELAADVADGARAAATLEMHALHCRFICEHIPPSTPVADIGEDLIHSLAVAEARGRRRGPDGETRRISGRTVSKRLCTLRRALKLARRRRWIDRLPEFPSLGRGYTPRTQAYLRDVGELERLCAYLRPHRAAFTQVGVWTGMRPIDVHGLRAYDDCDPFASPPWYLRRSTKTRMPAVAQEMPQPLAVFLRAWFRSQDLQPGQPVVPIWPKDQRARTLRTAGARLGLLIRRAMDLRHTCATWAAHELGSITPGLANVLGHRSAVTTATYYVHALPPANAAVASALTRAGRRRGPKRVPPGLRSGGPKKETAAVLAGTAAVRKPVAGAPLRAGRRA